MNDDVLAIHHSIDRLFEEKGQLSQYVKNYTPRQAQIEMAKAITPSILENNLFLAEAGTGTGKTFAYLAPALLSGKKVIVSTGTKALQDQIFYRDLPLLCTALDRPLKRALLKGRNNYVCHYHLHHFVDSLISEESYDWEKIQIIREWASTTKTGDKTELPNVSEEDPIWSHVTSTSDNCLGSHCPHYARCPVFSARKAAMTADIVVINHHLFFADGIMKGKKSGQLLPHFDVVVFDEAHQLPEISRRFFSTSLSTTKIYQFLRELDQTVRSDAPESSSLIHLIKSAQNSVHTFFENSVTTKRYTWTEAWPTIETILKESYTALKKCADELIIHCDRTPELENAYEKLQNTIESYHVFLEKEKTDSNVRWVEYRPRGFTCFFAPLNVDSYFREYFQEEDKSWIFCSATLSVHQSFEHFSRLVGIEGTIHEGISGIWESPFDYPKQARLYIPSHIPESNHPEHTRQLVSLVKNLVRANTGGSFFLFTTHRALQEAAALIRENWQEDDLSLFVQNESGKSVLLEKFRRSKKGLLLGTQTFWEGVDVRGSALTLVIIDKIPFSPPDDPILSAQIDFIKGQGGQPFQTLQLPSAVLTLKQGAGRLIRDQTDYGILVIADKRIQTRSYGKIIRNSLPPMPLIQDEQEAIQFLSQASSDSKA